MLSSLIVNGKFLYNFVNVHSLLVFFVLSIIIYLILLLCVNLNFLKLRKKYLKIFFTIIAIFIVLVFVSSQLYKSLAPPIGSQFQSQILSVGANYYNGGSIYPQFSSGLLYASAYGPMPYLMNGGVFYLTKSFVFTKIFASLLYLLGIYIWYRVFRLRLTKIQSLVLVFCIYIPLLQFNYISGVGADLFPLLLVGLSYLLYYSTFSWKKRGIILALFGALLSTTKLHYVIALLPLGFNFFLKYKFLRAVYSVTLFIFFGAMIWLMPRVDLFDYISLLKIMSGHSFSSSILIGNIQTLILALVPAWLIFILTYKKFGYKGVGIQYFIFLCTSVVLAIIGSKKGSGAGHLHVMFAVAYTILIFNDQKTNPVSKIYSNFILMKSNIRIIVVAFLVSWFAVNFLLGFSRQFSDIIFFKNRYKEKMTEEINNINKSNPGKKIHMGIGSGRPFSPRVTKGWSSTYYRALLPALGHPYILDSASWIDFTENIKLPNGFVDRVKNCEIDIWLIPKNQKPFALTWRGEQVFSNNFQDLFVNTYNKINSSTNYDLWGCKSLEPEPI